MFHSKNSSIGDKCTVDDNDNLTIGKELRSTLSYHVTFSSPESQAIEEYPAVFAYGKESTLYIEMPLYTSSMREYLSNTHLSESQTLWVLFQIISAVHHIHSHGIVHRDIKMDNILVKQEDGCLEVVLTDFGMSHDSLKCTKKLDRKWGNPMLMPPEIALLNAAGCPDYTGSDIWCVGSLVYELLGSDNPFSKLRSDRYDPRELPPLPSDDPVLQDLVLRLLSRDPRLRPSPLQCLIVCGILLWLPTLFSCEDVTQEEAARQLTLLSWHTYRQGRSGCGPELVGLMYFLKFASGMEIWKVVNSFVK
jgi:serine/threonine protein kinase